MTVRGQLTTPVPSPSGTLIVLNVGEGSERHFEIQDTEAGYRTILSAAELQFRSEPISKAALDAAWSPDGSSVAIEIALNKSTSITRVYTRQGDSFSPLPLNAFQANHKIIPLGWHGSHDLTISIDGPYPATAGRPTHGRLRTYRFRPNKSQFEKVYESPPSRLKPAKLVLYLDKSRDDTPYLREFREKHGFDGTYLWRRDTAVLFSGSAAEDMMTRLLTAPHSPSKSLITGLYSVGTLLYIDEHDRARCMISTTDAPQAEIFSTESNAILIWTTLDHRPPPRPGEVLPDFERYIARDFYRKLLPELRRVNSDEMERIEDFIRRSYSRSLEEMISKMFGRY